MVAQLSLASFTCCLFIDAALIPLESIGFEYPNGLLISAGVVGLSKQCIKALFLRRAHSALQHSEGLSRGADLR